MPLYFTRQNDLKFALQADLTDNPAAELTNTVLCRLLSGAENPLGTTFGSVIHGTTGRYTASQLRAVLSASLADIRASLSFSDLTNPNVQLVDFTRTAPSAFSLTLDLSADGVTATETFSFSL